MVFKLREVSFLPKVRQMAGSARLMLTTTTRPDFLQRQYLMRPWLSIAGDGPLPEQTRVSQRPISNFAEQHTIMLGKGKAVTRSKRRQNRD